MKIIAGVDEVGRGSLVGPVYAAAVILKKSINTKLLKDSKSISNSRRKVLFSYIKKNSIWAIGKASLKEIEQLNALEKKYDNVLNIAGKFSFEEELQLISSLDLMISMDSGNAHLSAMQQVKTITLWGVTHPYAGFAPFDQPADFCLLSNLEKYPKIPCSVYGNNKKLINKEYSISDHLTVMNETDRTSVGLLFHENIIDVLSKYPKEDILCFYCNILENFCFSDYIDRVTFQKQITCNRRRRN